MQAVILAAGLGLRLRPLTETKPKGLVPILGKPLLAWTLERLPSSIDEIIIVTGWLGQQIESTFGNSYHGIPIAYAPQSPIDGTATALHCIKDLVHGTFLVVNGDDIYSATDLERLSSAASWAVLAVQVTAPLLGAFDATEDGLVARLVADNTNNPKWLNCGAYLTSTAFFDLPLVGIPVRDKTEYSLPHTLIQSPARHPVRLVPATQWLPIGTPEQLAKAEKLLDNI